MMVTSEETIKNLQNEVLRLRLMVFQQGQMLDQRGRPPGQDLDETKRELIADLMTTNEELRRQIKELNARYQDEGEEPEREPSEPERPQMIDVDCQTNLDRLNIEQLIEASLALKKLKRQQLQQQEQLIREKQEALHKQQQPIYHNVHLERPSPMQSGGRMSADEKESLDKLFKLDGLLTIARDRLRAVALN